MLEKIDTYAETETPVEQPQRRSLTLDEIQRIRYMILGGKGEDGAPPYARDVSLIMNQGRENRCTTMVEGEDGEWRYRRQGD